MTPAQQRELVEALETALAILRQSAAAPNTDVLRPGMTPDEVAHLRFQSIETGVLSTVSAVEGPDEDGDFLVPTSNGAGYYFRADGSAFYGFPYRIVRVGGAA